MTALDANPARSQRSELLDVVPNVAFRLFITIGVGLCAAITAAFALSVDVTCTGRGRLVDPEGSTTLRTPTAAYVAEVLRVNGEATEAGSVVLKLSSVELEAAVTHATKRREVAEQRLARRQVAFDGAQRDIEALLRERAGLARLTTKQQKRIEKIARERAAAHQRLATEGLLTPLEAKESELDLHRQMQVFLAMQGDYLTVQSTILDFQLESRRRLEEAADELENAKADEGAARAALDQLVIRAPFAGRVEGIHAKRGTLIESGAELAKLVPLGSPTSIVAFVNEADRAFLEPGANVRMELDQLPAGEFGVLHGRVKRVATELAARGEIDAELAQSDVPAALYRVEAEVTDPPANVRSLLRSGMLVTARFELRQRRLAALVFAPLRGMLER